MRDGATRCGAAALGVIVGSLAIALSGCGAAGPASSAQPDSGSQAASSPPSADVATMLNQLGFRRIYVMAGDRLLHARLGEITSTGLAPARTRSRVKLLSTVASNGRTVVIEAAGMAGGYYQDAVYQIVGDRVNVIAAPGSGRESATVAADGTLAAVSPDGGFSTRAPGSRTWRRDHRLAHQFLANLTWGDNGNAYTVLHPGSPAASLVKLPRRGTVRTLRRIPCANLTLVAPDGHWIVGRLAPLQPQPGCEGRGATVFSVDHRGGARMLPAEWDPVAWAQNSESLLVARGPKLAVWHVRTRLISNVNDIGVHVWMAAPVWRH